MKYTVAINKEEGWLIGEVLELPGCVTQAKTLEELNMRLKDAINGYIASLRDHGEPVPQVQVQIHIIEV